VFVVAGDSAVDVEGFGDSFSNLGDFSSVFIGVISFFLFEDLGVFSLEEVFLAETFSLLFGGDYLTGDFLGDSSSTLGFLTGDLAAEKIENVCLACVVDSGLTLTGLSSSESLTILFFLLLLTFTGEFDSSISTLTSLLLVLISSLFSNTLSSFFVDLSAFFSFLTLGDFVLVLGLSSFTFSGDFVVVLELSFFTFSGDFSFFCELSFSVSSLIFFGA